MIAEARKLKTIIQKSVEATIRCLFFLESLSISFFNILISSEFYLHKVLNTFSILAVMNFMSCNRRVG